MEGETETGWPNVWAGSPWPLRSWSLPGIATGEPSGWLQIGSLALLALALATGAALVHFIAPDTLVRGRACGLDIRRALADNDAWGYFAGLGDLLVTGPTRTNVNDFRAILVGLE